MLNKFQDFYELKPIEFKKVWDECIFIYDTNVLLNLYRYSDETREELIRTIDYFKERTWLPYQIGLEFHFNRLSVIQSQIDSYNRISKSIDKKSSSIKQELNEELKEYKKRHPRIDIEDILNKLDSAVQSLIQDIKTLENNHPDYIKDNDTILERLNIIFEERVGDSYSQDKLNQIFKEGEERYKLNIPPGYEDLGLKKGKKRYLDGISISSEYGDLIIWNEIIDLASKNQKSVIFITDDVKKDWWEIIRGKTFGPRVELINEFRIKTNNTFYMYKTDRFMNFAKNYLNENVSQKAIEEIKNYRNIEEEFYKIEYPYLNPEDWEEIDKKYVDYEDAYEFINNRNEIRRVEYEKNRTSFNPGDFVEHKKWGLGQIIGTRGHGDLQEIDVKFEIVGLKRLLSKYAPLNKIIE